MSDATAGLVERARSLAPLLAEHAEAAERERRPPDRVIQALEEAGIFRLMVPRCYGGLELDLDTFLEVGLALSEGDGSMGWVATFYIEHNWMLCQFPEGFQRALYEDRQYVLAPAMVAPGGVARPVEGGLLVSGRWPWGTGSAHGDWVIVGARVEDPAAPAAFDLRFLALPRAEVKIEDTWHVDGMRATASNDVIVEERLVPLDRSVGIGDMASGVAHGARLHDAPLYRTPMLPILGMAASMPALGQARSVVRAFRERMSERVRIGQPVKQASLPAAQRRLGRAELELRQTELLMRQAVAEIMERRNAATLEERTRWMASFAWAVHQSKRVIASVCDASGAKAHFLSDPLQRAKRDVDTMACHVVFDLDQRLESVGRSLLGLDPGAMV